MQKSDEAKAKGEWFNLRSGRQAALLAYVGEVASFIAVMFTAPSRNQLGKHTTYNTQQRSLPPTFASE